MVARKTLGTVLTALACATGVSNVDASVVINGTRVVYPGEEREVTIKVTNDGAYPALVQAWLDDGDPAALPQDGKAPFAMVPPLFRLDPKKGQMLRIVYNQDPVATDKESVFWLNVLEVPPREGDKNRNLLQLAFRSRIKLFYRPPGLHGDAREAPAQVTWKFVPSKNGGYALQASNPTPFHVTFTKLTAISGAAKWTNETGGMVDPGGTAEFDVGNAKTAGEPTEVDYTFLDDYGAGVNGKYSPHSQR